MQTVPAHADELTTPPRDLAGPGDPLAVIGVVVSALADDVLTPGGPDRYTVTASLSRRPDPREVEAIHGDATRRKLAEAGFGRVRLQLADRRLLIMGTSLQELRDGLAPVIGAIVRTVTLEVLAEKESARKVRADLDDMEHERFVLVAEAAAAIDFES